MMVRSSWRNRFDRARNHAGHKLTIAGLRVESGLWLPALPQARFTKKQRTNCALRRPNSVFGKDARKIPMQMQTSSPKIVTKEQASFTELLDNQEGIILDLENLHYYTLNAAAVFLWKQMRSGSANTAESLSAALATAFNINADLAELDSRTFLDELEGNALVFQSEFDVTVI